MSSARSVAHTGGSTEWTFTGEQNDPNGLEYLRARYHDTSTGRLLSSDPVLGLRANPDSMNRYVYAKNNSVLLVDPSGRQDCGAGGEVEYFGENPGEECGAPTGSYPCRSCDNQPKPQQPQRMPLEGTNAPRYEGGCHYGRTPNGLEYTRHQYENYYGTGKKPPVPGHQVPGEMIDETVEYFPSYVQPNGRDVYYNPVRDVTVIMDGNEVLTAYRGDPASNALKAIRDLTKLYLEGP